MSEKTLDSEVEGNGIKDTEIKVGKNLTYEDLQKIKRDVREEMKDYIPPFNNILLPTSRPWPQNDKEVEYANRILSEHWELNNPV